MPKKEETLMSHVRTGCILALLLVPAAAPAQGQETGLQRELPAVDARGKVALWIEGSTVAHFRNLRISPAG